ncbi:ATP-binding cassette domain-containing protein [Bifidobacterium callimiconis]|uniref:ATP-binding cassette domain-containing protein n=1 Tax=Bifidobacterium callimiconis TaxID=2306973 RepID=UPI001F0B1C6F|nr:ATP-binding cassette domain-containing protein [Bifidobacterium callimiconis]
MMESCARAGQEYAVHAESLGFYRQQRLILADVNLSIPRGQRWVLFGPNGIGKSTLVSMMAMRMFPNVGHMEVLGSRTVGGGDLQKHRSRIALASASFGREISPIEDPLNVVMGVMRGQFGNEWREHTLEEYERAMAIMERFGIDYLAGKTMAKLSEGERTRVLICRALLADADLLILDEPTTGLDLGGRELIMRELGGVGTADDDRTIVIVTHQLEEIPAGFDHIALMGRIDRERYDDYCERHPQIYSTLEGNPLPGSVVFTGALEDGLTEDRLGALFGLDLEIRRIGTRWTARRKADR